MKIYPLEHQEQKRVFDSCKYLKIPNSNVAAYDLMFAVPNGGSRSKRRGLSLEAIRLKAEGVKPGVPDIFLAHANSHYHGLFIEMKRASKSLSKVSDEQKLWQERLLKQGYLAVICYGADEAITVIKDYIKNE